MIKTDKNEEHVMGTKYLHIIFSNKIYIFISITFMNVMNTSLH
jgi:hypothetical protein